LKSITIPSKVTNIGNSVFEGCSSIKSITLPSKVTRIEECTFKDCKKLKTITIKSKKLKYTGASSVYGIVKNAKIRVPKGKAKAYKKLFVNSRDWEGITTGYESTMNFVEFK